MKNSQTTIFILLFLTLFVLPKLKSQEVLETTNLYTTIENLYKKYPAVNVEDSEKNGKGKELDRSRLFWSQRLAPHGDVSVAAAAIVGHAVNFNAKGKGSSINKSPSCGVIATTWKEEGPFDKSGYPGGGNGQINRITYDPQFNGTTNKTVYGASFYGGLWRSTNNGDDWTVVGTDNQLPQTSVSGIGVDHNNSNNLFICTGNGDNLNLDILDPGFPSGRSTPNFTSGIYRSKDYGLTWTSINNGFINNFIGGGTTTDLKVDPSDANRVYVASSLGLYRTTNGLAPSPTWNKLNLSSGVGDFVSGLEIHPTISSTVYAASDEIVKSTNSGNTWTKLTGTGTTLDFSSLPNGFDLKRIKLAVTPAAVNNLYAIFIGEELSSSASDKDVLYIYRYTGGAWAQLYYSLTTNNIINGEEISTSWMGLAVDPKDADRIIFGSIKHKEIKIGNPGYYSFLGNNIHNDIHEIVFEPIIVGKLFSDFMVAHHGGISKSIKYPSTNAPPYFKQIKRSSSGINTSMLWGLDVSRINNQNIIMGRQDNGVGERVGSAWQNSTGLGDGYGVMYSDEGTSISETYTFISGTYEPLTPVDASHVANSATKLTRTLGNGSWVNADFKNKDHPNSGKTIFGFSELFSEFNYHYPRNIAKVQSDIYADANFAWKGTRRIRDFAISKSNDNYAYIVVYGRDGIGRESDFLRTTTGLSEDVYIDKYAGAPTPIPTPKFSLQNTNLPTVLYNGTNYRPFITGVTVSTKNHLDVWISIGGFFDHQKIYKSTDGGLNWLNADPNNCLPNLPTNTLVYQEGTDDRIYLAMDDGVYVSDNSMNGSWKKFGDLPNVAVHQLIVNECSDRIYAGTYGRGIWSAEMLPRTENYGELVISNNTNFNENRTVSGNILVEAGNKLTITSTIYMPANGQIIVEPNAILEIDGGTITNSCGNSWDKISLEGSNAHDQFPLIHPTHQAKLILKNNALLDNVQYGITFGEEGQWSDFGGLVQAEDATIRCTRRAASFMSYPYTNHSYFKRCTFEYVPTIVDPPLSLVTIWDNNGIGFFGCSFIDNSGLNQYSQYGGNGIFSIDASYSVGPDCNYAAGAPPVSPCVAQYFTRSSFTNLNQGIYVATSGGTATIDVSETDFYDNTMAIRDEAVNNVRFVLNNILTGGVIKQGYNSHQVGFYSDNSTGFEVEQNAFETRVSAMEPVIGVNIKNSGYSANEVYNNTFKNNTIGEKYEGMNRDPFFGHLQGLQFLCNDNLAGNGKDVVISVYGLNPNEGVRDNQGSSSPANSASNLFLNSSNINIENNSSFNINYHYNSSVLAENPFNTTGPISKINVNISNTCQDRFWITGQDGGIVIDPFNVAFQGIINNYYNERKSYSDLLYNYSLNIDNGNTESLIKTIDSYFSENPQAMRDELLSHSPYLSEKVLRDAAQSGILTDELLLEICLANPDATKNGKFLDLVEFDITNPLPRNMVQLIYQSWEKETQRTIMENQLADLNADLGRISSKLIHLYSMDSLDHTDSIRSILESQKTLSSKYQLVELELQLGNFSDALTQLEVIQSSNTLTIQQQEEHINLLKFVNFRKDIEDYMRLNESQLSILRSIALAKTGRSSTFAQNILCFGYQECDFGSDEPEKKLESKRTYNKEQLSSKIFSNTIKVLISPNPARDKVKISLEGMEDGFFIQLAIKNVNGQTVLKKQLNAAITLLDINELNKGIYFYELWQNDNRVAVGKLIIQ